MSATKDTPYPLLHRLALRIYYEDTDFSGHVYHASYLRFMERARTEWVRQTGFDQRAAFAATPPVVFVVRRMTIEYLKPAHMDDELAVETALIAARGASLDLAQRIRRGGELLVDAKVLVACLAGGRPARLPREIATALAASPFPLAGEGGARAPMRSPWRWPALFLLASGLCLLLAMPYYESPLLIFMHENLERLARFIAEHRAAALALYVLVYVTSIALSFPAAILLTLIGGYGFGILTGGLAAAGSATLGGLAAFLALRALSRDWSRKLAGFDLSRIVATLRDDAASYLVFLRLMPVFPFWLVNLAAALAGVRVATFLWTTFGIMPAAFTFATAGEALGSILEGRARAYRDCIASGAANCTMHIERAAIVDRRLLLALGALGALALIPVAVRRIPPLARFCRRKGWIKAGEASREFREKPLKMSETLRPDLCVIGAGAAGLSVAAAAAALGVKTALIERGRMGGECLNTGCVPSKALIAAAHAVKGAPGALRSPDARGPEPADFARAMAHVKAVIAEIAPNDSAERYAALGVEVIRSEAAFVDRMTVAAGDKRIKARRFVVATGSKPMIPALVGIDTMPYLTSETAFDLAERAGHLLIIGGGPTGCELAQAFRRLGSEVTLFDAGPILPREDRELAGIVAGSLRRDGVVLRENVRLTAAAAISGIRLHYSDAASRPQEANGTHLLIAAGREAETADLGLEAGFIKKDKDGIIVDDAMRTSNPRVFAIGDCAGGAAAACRSTHAASLQASLVIRKAVFRMPARFEPATISRVTYTDPEIAAVGLSEETARARHGSVRILRFPFSETDRARIDAEPEGLVKLVASPKGHLLGAAICGKGAGELIPLWTLALRERMKLSKIASLAIPYPTLGEASRRAALEFYLPLARSPLLRRVLRFLQVFGS